MFFQDQFKVINANGGGAQEQEASGTDKTNAGKKLRRWLEQTLGPLENSSIMQDNNH